jgi:hypothetical protein
MGQLDSGLRALAVGSVLAVALSACGDVPAPTVPSPTPRPTTPPCDPGTEQAWGLFGTVTDPAGQPIESAVVQVEMGEFFDSVRTTAEGKFSASCVWGLFEINVAHLDYNAVQRAVVVEPGERREVTFELEPLEQ